MPVALQKDLWLDGVSRPKAQNGESIFYENFKISKKSGGHRKKFETKMASIIQGLLIRMERSVEGYLDG